MQDSITGNACPCCMYRRLNFLQWLKWAEVGFQAEVGGVQMTRVSCHFGRLSFASLFFRFLSHSKDEQLQLTPSPVRFKLNSTKGVWLVIKIDHDSGLQPSLLLNELWYDAYRAWFSSINAGKNWNYLLSLCANIHCLIHIYSLDAPFLKIGSVERKPAFRTCLWYHWNGSLS